MSPGKVAKSFAKFEYGNVASGRRPRRGNYEKVLEIV